MSVNAISQDLPAIKLQQVNNEAASLSKPANLTPLANDLASSSQAVQSGTFDSLQKKPGIQSSKPTTEASNEDQKQPVRGMSHIVETYDQQGQMILKFMDSNNNLLYQIPSEMEARMREQMKQPESSANTTG